MRYMFLVIAALMFSGMAMAEGPIFEPGVQDTKEVDCTNATTREDGTPLALDEIIRVEIGFTQDATGANAGSNFTKMAGGCQPITYDLTLLPAEGQWYEFGWTVACGVPMVNGVCPQGEEQYSRMSDMFPFEYRTVVRKALPAPPVLTK